MNSLPPRSDANEWTTVGPKKTSSYIPPHLRKALAEAEKNKPVDFHSTTAFPSMLKSAPVPAVASPWESKVSFKEKIDGLIALEKLTEQEKQARLEERRAMDGWEILSLRITPEVLANFMEKRKEQERRAQEWNTAVDCGTYGMISLENYIPPPKSEKNTVLYVQEEYSDEEELDCVDYPTED
jgi:hypothetical protein